MSGTPLARPDAWRLWWSFTWRQAAVMVLTTVLFSVVVSILHWAGVPLWLTYGSIPYFTFAIVFYSGFEACRRLLGVYDIRLKGGPSDEQDHRHRR